MTGPGSANEGYGTYIQSSSFDIGNLLAKGSATLAYGATQPHTPSSVSTVGSYGYDGNGNRSTDPTYSYTYDAENHLTLLKQGSTTILQNTFDGDGARLVRAVTAGATTHYVGGWYEYDPNAHQATVYYPFNGIPVAMNKAGTLSYLHHDHLGSLVSASNATGTEIASARYWPFGGLRSTTGTLPTDRLFTGQIRDLGDDRFYFFRARYYDATIGKFQTADTVVPDAKNPQALNRYSYGVNNPLRYVDPSGHAYASDGSTTSDGFTMPWSTIGTAADTTGDPSPTTYNAAIAFSVQTGRDPDLVEMVRMSGPRAVPEWVKHPDIEVQQPGIVSVVSWVSEGKNGAAYATVTKQTTGSGRNLQIALATDQTGETRVNPQYSVQAGSGTTAFIVPQRYMSRVAGTYISAPGFSPGDYTAEVNIPGNAVGPIALSIYVNPYTEGAYLVNSFTSRGIPEFGQATLDFSLP